MMGTEDPYSLSKIALPSKVQTAGYMPALLRLKLGGEAPDSGKDLSQEGGPIHAPLGTILLVTVLQEALACPTWLRPTPGNCLVSAREYRYQLLTKVKAGVGGS